MKMGGIFIVQTVQSLKIAWLAKLSSYSPNYYHNSDIYNKYRYVQ